MSRPQPDFPLVLLYGPDRGLIAERAQALAARCGVPLDDPFGVIRFDAAELERDPGRLLDEARTISMFGGNRVLWVRNAGSTKSLADTVRDLEVSPPPDTVLIVEAGDLKKGAALRTAFESATRAMALPCYPDEGRDLDRLVTEVIGGRGLEIEEEARQLLRERLGGDRLASRGELEKLALYVGTGRITRRHVADLSGDVSGLSAEDLVDMMLSGDVARLDRAQAELVRRGGAAQQTLLAAQRQLQSLHQLRVQMQAKGQAADAAVASARPPIHFSRRRGVESALRQVTVSSLPILQQRLADAILESRRRPALADAIAARVMRALAAEFGRRTRA